MNFISAKTPKIVKRIFPNYVWDIATEKRELYLTFDDGPTPVITPWVLDTLKAYDAKATFFCIGNNVMKHPEIFEHVLKDGHAIGNHTQNHQSGWKLSLEDYLSEVKECQETIDITCRLSGSIQYKNGANLLFRPPYGRIRPSQAKGLIDQNYKIVMWDVLAFDWSTSVSPEDSFHKVADNTVNGSIIVLHDSLKAAKNMQYSLPRILKFFKEKGFRFNALS